MRQGTGAGDFSAGDERAAAAARRGTWRGQLVGGSEEF